MTTNWTKDDLRTYLLIYCANADFSISEKELTLIKSRIEKSDFDKIKAEFEEDNDYQSIQKIQSAYKTLNYENADVLMQEVMDVFQADGDYDTLEQNLNMGLKNILRGL